MGAGGRGDGGGVVEVSIDGISVSTLGGSMRHIYLICLVYLLNVRKIAQSDNQSINRSGLY